MATIKFSEVKKELMQNPEFKKEYEALGDEFNAIEALIDTRNKAKLTQAQVAEKMGITQSAVAKIESGAWNIKFSTFSNYLKACGQRVAITKLS
ncbi:transcriptional regulator [Helicobacter enhydrae]|uniref:Transcriptional regulator n=1 Tax=Helicobacter enhydrae TaxID=222136 RepID=A0A1B1U6I0_9HELI|nr:helix-turn-helix transcriptional regulator [Helicobacter enhydrae]ANV98346.1 transcriptional regulator [Helicobacter enhydrae]